MWYTTGGRKVESHDDLDERCTDIVYILHYSGGYKYIGKKAVRAIRKKPPLKGYKRNRRIMTNLPFMKYQGSHAQAKEMTPFRKEILYQCSQRKASTYLELELLVEHRVLFNDKYFNDNISGKFFKNSLDGMIKT